MRSHRAAGPLPALLLLLGAALGAAPAQAARVTAGTGSGLAGQTVDVTLTASDLTGLGVQSYQFVMTYNASVVTATDVIEAGTLPATAGWGDAVFNVTSGQISVAHAGAAVLAGAGPLVTLRFLINPALLGSSSTSLVFQSFTFNEGVPNDTTTNGSITVNPTPVITVTPNTGEVVRGQTLAFSVSGSVTPPVSWFTTDAGVATISGTGLLTGVAPGSVRVFAVDNAARRDTTDGLIDIRGMGLTVGTGSAVQGNPGTVPVTVTDLTGLGIRSGQFTVSFNANLVTPTGVATAGTMLDGYGTTSFGVTGNTLTVDFAGTADLNGSGTLCVLNFATSATTSGVTTLTLASALFNETLPAKRTNGSFTVSPLPTITVSPENVTLLAGQTQLFTVSGSVTPPVTWSTLDPTVATIDAAGLLTAVAGGVTKVRAVDNVGAMDENTSVTVYDFRVSVPTIDALPGVTVFVPLNVDRDLSPLNIYSVQYTLTHNATYITDAQSWSGLISAWGPPVQNELSDRISIAAAGTAPLGSGSLVLDMLRLVISPSTPLNTNIPLTLSGFVCNEGKPSAQVVNGLLRVRSTTGVEPGNPAALALLPAQPNPFASATRVAFTLPQAAGRVRLAVYGLDGRRVRTLVDEALPAGPHEVTWDGRDGTGSEAGAGVYFVRLEANGQHLERKVVRAR